MSGSVQRRGDDAVGFEGCNARHVGERTQAPGEGAGALGLLELGLDIGPHVTPARLGGGAIGLQSGNESIGGGRHVGQS